MFLPTFLVAQNHLRLFQGFISSSWPFILKCSSILFIFLNFFQKHYFSASCCSYKICRRILKFYQMVANTVILLHKRFGGFIISIFRVIAICWETFHYLQQFAATCRWSSKDKQLVWKSMSNCTRIQSFTFFAGFEE